MGIFSTRRTTQAGDPAHDFDPNSPRYKCCCGLMLVTTGAKVMAVVHLLMISMHLIIGSVNYARIGDVYVAFFVKSVVNFVLGCLVVACLFYALRSQRRRFMFPLLVYQIAFGIMMIVMIILLIKLVTMSGKSLWEMSHIVGVHKGASGASSGSGSAATPSVEDRESKSVTITILAITLMLACVFALAMDVRYFMVIFLCFKYFRDKELYEDVSNSSVRKMPLKLGNTTLIMFDEDNNPYERRSPPTYYESAVNVRPPAYYELSV